MELKWPFYAQTYFNIYTNMGSVSTRSISLECVLNDIESKVNSLYVETIFALSIPFLTFLLAFLILIVLSDLLYKKKQTARYIVVVIVSSIFLQTTIIRMLYNNLFCEEIDGSFYLSLNLEIECQSEERNKWLLYCSFI